MADGTNLGSAYGEVQIGTGGAEESIKSLAQTMRGLGGSLVGLSAPFVALSAVAFKSAGDFEQSLNIMQQVTGATGDQMATLQQQALSLGATTSFSAGEAAEAMLELGKAGMTPVEIGDAIAGTMDLAAAGNLGLAEAATIASNAINAFNLPASEAASVANTLAAAANASSADVSDLAAGMQMAGAVFAANGQSVEDLAAGMALLANNGIAGSDAGTSLKTMLMRLVAPTDDAAAAMQTLGLNAFNADGSMRSFGDIVADLETATAGLSDQQRGMALNTIFGADAIRAASILASEGADGFSEMQAAVTKDGAAAATAAARMKGLNGAVEYLKGSIDSFLINAAYPFLESKAAMIRRVADLITSIGNLPAPLRDAAMNFMSAAAAIGSALLVGSKLIPVFSGIGTVIAFLVSPVGLLVAAGAALAAVFVTDFMGARTALVNMVNALLDLAGIDLSGITDGLSAFGNYLGAVAEDGDYLNDWLTHLPEPIQPAVMALGQLVAAFSGLAQTGKLDEFIASLTAIDWGGALAAVGDSLNGLRDGMVAALQSINWAAALTAASTWLDGLKNGVLAAVGSIPWGEALTTAGDWLAALRDGVIAAVTSIPWATALATAGNFLGGLAQGVINRVTTINWGGLLAQAGDYLAGLWGNVVAALGRIDWAGALTAAGALTTNLAAQVVAAIQGIDWAGALVTAGNAFAGLETAVAAALGALGFSQAASALGGIKALFVGLPEAVSSTGAALTSFGAQATATFAPIAAFFAPAMGRLRDAIVGLPEGMAPLLPKLGELGGAFGNLLNALQPVLAVLGFGLMIAVDFGVNHLATTFETLPGILGPIIDQITATVNLIAVIIREVIAGVQAAINGDWAGVWESAKVIAGEFNTFFRGLFARLGTFMSAVAKNISEPIIDTLTDLGVDVQPILTGIQGTFETVWGAIQAAIQAVVDIVGTVTDAISGFKSFLDGLQLRNPFEGIAAAGQAVMDAIGAVGNQVSGGGADGDPNTPEAGGTSYFRGGMAQINERGYEQIVLPAGSRVYTHGQTNNLPGQEPTTININMGGVTVANDYDARRLGNVLRDQLALLGI